MMNLADYLKYHQQIGMARLLAFSMHLKGAFKVEASMFRCPDWVLSYFILFCFMKYLHMLCMILITMLCNDAHENNPTPAPPMLDDKQLSVDPCDSLILSVM